MSNFAKNSLVIVDLQIDFCSQGALAVEGGEEIVTGINKLTLNSTHNRKFLFDKVILTADWHPSGHISYASTHNLEPYDTKVIDGAMTTFWPDHCIEGSRGAGFHPDLNTDRADLIVRKGRNCSIDSYSAFYENDRKTPTGLSGYLENHGIENVYLCGLAFDWCVYFSALDSVRLGFTTFVIRDLTRAVNVPSGYAVEKEREMEGAGIKIIDSVYFKLSDKPIK